MANFCVRPVATGSGNGSDWNNCLGASFTPARGTGTNVYYMASGSYGDKVWSVANSGTNTITIKKATIADHGPTAGWSDTYGGVDANGAIWTQWNITTGYWTFDGVTGGGPGSWESNFGFRVWLTVSGGQTYAIGDNSFTLPVQTNLFFFHVDTKGRGRAYAGGDTDNFYLVSSTANLKIRYCFMHDTDRTMILTYPNSLATGLIEYCKFARNGVAAHREAWSCGVNHNNIDFRYNLLEDIFATGMIGLVNGTGTSSTWNIHGNVVYWTGNFLDGIVSTGWICTRNDAANGTSPQVHNAVCNTWKVYNNTIVNVRNNSIEIGVHIEAGSGNLVTNNIYYHNNGTTGVSWTGTSDYNWFYDNTNNGASGAHDAVGSANPFADSQPWLTGNWALRVDISGTNLGAPYNTDMFGTVGTSRGAIQFSTAGPDTTPPAAPTGVTVT